MRARESHTYIKIKNAKINLQIVTKLTYFLNNKEKSIAFMLDKIHLHDSGQQSSASLMYNQHDKPNILKAYNCIHFDMCI